MKNRIVIASRIPPRHFEASRLRGSVTCMYWKKESDSRREGKKKHWIRKLRKGERRKEGRKEVRIEGTTGWMKEERKGWMEGRQRG